MSFTKRSIENLKEQVDIVDVIGRAVPLKKAGANHKGVCPFHSEKTPSFVVSEQKQYFTCFGCGASGDVIEFVKRYYNLDFNEAVEKLGREYGIELEESRSYGENLDVYYRINKAAAEFFYKSFTEKANKGYSYMKKRSIDPKLLKRFGIGYADAEWDSLHRHLTGMGFDPALLVELGLSVKNGDRYYDKFRNRVIFPIINTSGKVIGFGGRAIDPGDNPKYLNSPESKVFRKKNNLYGLNLSRKAVAEAGYIILVEGYMDTIGLYRAGIENVSASLGTALTENQARLIKRYTHEVVLCYDSDEAGRNAALRGMEILKKEGLRVKVLHVTEGKDPDEFIKEKGRDAFLKLLEKALPYVEYRIAAIRSRYDLTSEDGLIECLRAIAKELRDYSPVEQDIYVRKVSQEMGISENALKREIGTVEGGGRESTPERRTAASKEREPLSPVDKDLLRLIVKNPDYLPKVTEAVEMLNSDAGNSIMSALEEEFGDHGTIDARRVLDVLDDADREAFNEIVSDDIPIADPDALLADCTARHRAEGLKKQERMLVAMLANAAEEDQGRLMEQLQEIRKQIRLGKDGKR